jgi:rRNA maturation endonuclease Nob1
VTYLGLKPQGPMPSTYIWKCLACSWRYKEPFEDCPNCGYTNTCEDEGVEYGRNAEGWYD